MLVDACGLLLGAGEIFSTRQVGLGSFELLLLLHQDLK
jgi:hypothetical protein